MKEARSVAKKKRSNKELTLEQKEKLLFQNTMIEAIVLMLGTFYICASYSCYSMLHPRADFNECISGTVSEILKNPLYFLPINYSLSNTFLICFLLFMFIFLQYTVNKVRVHQNANTLKGKTHWADTNDILERYADAIEVPNPIVRLVQTIFKKRG